MSLTFYFAPQSTASVTTLVLEELGTPCERVKLDIRKGETKKPEFLKINPNGCVPTIVHDGVVIFESAAITMYLGETFGEKAKLWPAAGPKRGEAMKWLVWAHVTLGEPVYRWARNTMWAPEDERNAKAAATASNDIAKQLKVLDGALADRSFLVGDYTLTDAHVNSFIDWLRHMKIDMTPFSHLNAWSKRCAERPAYARAMQRENASWAERGAPFRLPDGGSARARPFRGPWDRTRTRRALPVGAGEAERRRALEPASEPEAAEAAVTARRRARPSPRVSASPPTRRALASPP